MIPGSSCPVEKTQSLKKKNRKVTLSFGSHTTVAVIFAIGRTWCAPLPSGFKVPQDESGPLRIEGS